MQQIYTIRAQVLRLDVVIKPQAKKSELIGILNNRLKIAIAATPVEGKANKELIRFMAKLLNLKKQEVIIVNGELNALKLIDLPILAKSKLDELVSQYNIA